MLNWYRKHFVFRYVGVIHMIVARDGERITATKPVVLMMTESGRRKAAVTNRHKIKGRPKVMFDRQYDFQIVPWLHGGPFPEGRNCQYKQDNLAELLVKIIDNKLQGKEKFNG